LASPPACRRALAVPALVLSFTRGAIVALVLGAILWLAFLRPRWAVAAAAIATVIALITAPATLRERFDPEETAGELPLRSDIWGSALDIYAEHPLTGVGVNNFGAAYERLPSVSASASQRRLLHNEQLLIPPHAQNLYLNVLAELGPLGVLALLALLIASVQIAYRGARIRDPGGRAVCIGVGAGWSVLLLHSLVEVTLMNEVVIPVFALTAVAAGFLALDRSEDEAGETATVQTANGG
jgi:O-antigen ligase